MRTSSASMTAPESFGSFRTKRFPGVRSPRLALFAGFGALLAEPSRAGRCFARAQRLQLAATSRRAMRAGTDRMSVSQFVMADCVFPDECVPHPKRHQIPPRTVLGQEAEQLIG